jgi:hypothetical protein
VGLTSGTCHPTTLLIKFSGPASQTCCFAHIINLITKTVIYVPQAQEGEVIDEAMKELWVLVGDLNVEELLTQAANSQSDNGDDRKDDDSEGWVDEYQKMLELELNELDDDDVQPVQTMLVKVGTIDTNAVDIMPDYLH